MQQADTRYGVRVRYITFATALASDPLIIAAQLRLPTVTDRQPAVVILHGSAGVDTRGTYHAEALNEAGIATLEPDLWSPRALLGGTGPNGRPQSVAETVPDAFGALNYLAARSDIDARRIGVMGFSWGGVLAMLTATRPYCERYLKPGAPRFAAHAPFYPVCWTYNTVPGHEFTELTGAPVFIQSGERDDYDQPDTCERLIRGLPAAARRCVTCKIYPDATHAFDRLGTPLAGDDPYSHLGKGGQITIAPNPGAAAAARRAMVAFFQRAFTAVGVQ
ncbi:MAG: hypothetical protein EPN38_04870 [Rhodanobacteraceae bacterium]|nr:MAG: hypothetical protein EPN38_04870 [Rhodanobacteraceae bacterium]